MERGSDQYEHIHDVKFANDLYNAVDLLFAERKIRSHCLMPDERECELELTRAELEHIGPILESYAIDAPHYAKIRISGFNPNIYAAVPAGAVKIVTEHTGPDPDYDTIISEYNVVIANMGEMVTRLVKSVYGKPEDHGKHAGHEKINEVIYVAEPIQYAEQRGLRALINALQM